MKPLLILMRIVFVGIFWSVFFLEGIRVVMLKNWRFDIIRSSHWQYALDLWLSGWVIDDAKEWAFVLIILTFIPLWLTGWAALSLISWEKLFLKIALLPLTLSKKLFFQPVQIIAHTTGVKRVKKKKSYKEIRPKSIRSPIDEKIYSPQTPGNASKPISANPAMLGMSAKPVEAAKESKFDHSLFKFDEEDDFDFDFDAFDTDKKAEAPVAKAEPENAAETPKNIAPNQKDKNSNKNPNNKNNNRDTKDNGRNSNNKDNKAGKAPYVAPAPSSALNTPNTPPRTNANSSMDVLKQKGYEVINGVTIKNNLIDFIGVSENQLCLCLIDKEPGDWLADEERFNDEEPLWFSESSHRISPVRKIDISRQALADKLGTADLKFEIKTYVIVQIGNLINAEDMFEIWDDIGVEVTRIDRGTPKELKLFSKTLEDAIAPINKDKLEKVKKLLRNAI